MLWVKFIALLLAIAVFYTHCEKQDPPPIEELENYFNEIDVESETAEDETRNAVNMKMQRWPNRTLYYVIASDYSDEEANNVRKALQTFNEMTCLNFVEAREDHVECERYLFYQKSPKMCGTRVGFNPFGKGPHNIHLTPRCLEFPGIIQHESLHVLGLYHEQSRYDRDNYIRVVYSNIPPKYQTQFVMYPPIYTSTLGIPYDYESLMHYSANAFARDPSKPSMRAIVGGEIVDRKMGQTRGPSEGDLKKIRIMYECEEEEE